jgi:two-component system nitrate/nitrite response regulator NarL
MRVWLVDDDEELLDSLGRALAALSVVDSTRLFRHPAEVLRALVESDTFDVALVDLGLPDLPGERLIAELSRARPGAPVVALTVRADVFGALTAGAIGYLLKEVSVLDLEEAIKLAASGGAPLSPAIGGRIVRRFHEDRRPREGGLRLTQREKQVLDLLCSGASYREVGRVLGIAEGTVQTYVKTLYEKLGVSSKAEAVRVAYETALVSPRSS